MGLIDGILNNDIAEIKAAIAADSKGCVKEVRDGLTGSFYAAKGGNLEINKILTEKSMAKYNEVDKDKRTVLFYAVESGNAELCKYYVERVGFSPLQADVNGITAFEYAHELGMSEIEKYFEEVCGFKYEDGYKNPIRRGFFPDPSIVRVGEDYYMVNSTFVFFPCIPISHSKDLIHWEIIGHAITNPQWAELDGLDGGRGYWAPDISYYEGRFYICATYRNNDSEKIVRRQMITSSERPEGPYDKPVFINVDGIDPSIFNDDDGRRYMVVNRGASIFELSKDAKEKISDVSLLYYGDTKRASEGPHILKKDGYYYLFQAEGGTGPSHQISVSRSRELFGIYEACPYNPVMTYSERNNPYIHRCGHGKPVQTPDGRWFIVYLCGRYIGGKYTVLGRETSIDEMKWTSEGWPIINNNRGASAFAKKPLPDCIMESTADEDFVGGKIPDVWYTLRGRDYELFDVKDSLITIYGGALEPDDTRCGSVLLRRQQSFDFEAETKMYAKLKEGGYGGMTCYYDEFTFFTFGIKRDGGKDYVMIRERRGFEPAQVIFKEEIKGDEFVFKTVTKGIVRELYLNGKKVYTIEDCTYLSDEGVDTPKRFTGAMTGMFCTGVGSSAAFDWFYMRDL